MAERKTSEAKDILTPREEAILETYGIARNHFEHARDPLISKQHIDLAREEQQREGRGSVMVREDAALPEHRPSDELARAVDRKAFDDRWQEEQEHAKADSERGDDYER